jgi:hypothetical protein
MRLVSAGILGLFASVSIAWTAEFVSPRKIVIPPIPNAPFRATLATEAVKYSFDGATDLRQSAPLDQRRSPPISQSTAPPKSRKSAQPEALSLHLKLDNE